MDEDLEVSFLKHNKSDLIKVWPRIPNISLIDETDIVRIVQQPILDARERLVFSDQVFLLFTDYI